MNIKKNVDSNENVTWLQVGRRNIRKSLVMN